MTAAPTPHPPARPQPPAREAVAVRLVGLDLPFGTLVRLLVKLALAAVPALALLLLLACVAGATLLLLSRALLPPGL